LSWLGFAPRDQCDHLRGANQRSCERENIKASAHHLLKLNKVVRALKSSWRAITGMPRFRQGKNLFLQTLVTLLTLIISYAANFAGKITELNNELGSGYKFAFVYLVADELITEPTNFQDPISTKVTASKQA
jgi:hypothetical protein